MIAQGLTIKQASIELKISQKTIRRHITKGVLVADKIGGKFIISDSSISHFRQTKADTLPGMISGFDPLKHVVIEREKWEGMLTRLGQLEEITRLLPAPRLPWYKRIFLGK